MLILGRYFQYSSRFIFFTYNGIYSKVFSFRIKNNRMIDFEYRVYQAKSPPPLFSKNCRKIAKVRRKQGGGLT